MAIDRSLISGSTMMLVLKLLSEKDRYGYEMIDGYEMIEALREKSENVFELKAGTLYPLLHDMVGKGYSRKSQKILWNYENRKKDSCRKREGVEGIFRCNCPCAGRDNL